MVAYNLVPVGSSVFRTGAPDDPGLWKTCASGKITNVADHAASPTGSRMSWSASTYTYSPNVANGGVCVLLPGETYTIGAQYRVQALIWGTSSQSREYLYYGIQDPGPTLTNFEEYTRGPIRTSTDYFWDDVIVTLGEWQFDRHGNGLEPDESGPVYIAISAAATAESGKTEAAIAEIRIDRLEGYAEYEEVFHADTPDTEEWTFSSTDVDGYIVSTATENVPEEPDPEEPEPGDELDPWDVHQKLVAQLAPRVAAFVGLPDDEDAIGNASVQLPVVAEYVRGYTRGRGWTGELPAMPLRVVIVSATARLAANPEQVSYYATGDYTERPAVLAGWTLAELAILRRYRRTAA